MLEWFINQAHLVNLAEGVLRVAQCNGRFAHLGRADQHDLHLFEWESKCKV